MRGRAASLRKSLVREVFPREDMAKRGATRYISTMNRRRAASNPGAGRKGALSRIFP